MADWNEPTNNTNTLSVLDALNDKIENAAKMDFSGDTNLPIGLLRYNTTNKQFESWSGTAWTSLSVLMPDGTAAAPSFSFSDDTNTGVYRVGTDRIGIATAGAFRFGIDEGGFAYFGNAIVSSSPTQGTISGTLASGTNIAGADLRIQGGTSTGTGAGGAIIFRTSPTGSTGSSSNASTERMRVKATGQVRFVPLAADPAGAATGDVYYNSTDNKLKVYNGTAWVDLH